MKWFDFKLFFHFCYIYFSHWLEFENLSQDFNNNGNVQTYFITNDKYKNKNKNLTCWWWWLRCSDIKFLYIGNQIVGKTHTLQRSYFPFKKKICFINIAVFKHTPSTISICILPSKDAVAVTFFVEHFTFHLSRFCVLYFIIIYNVLKEARS